MASLKTFETGKSNVESSQFMVQNQKSFQTLAELEFMAELKNREDLVKNGFKVKRLSTPFWIMQKCGDIFKNHNQI